MKKIEANMKKIEANMKLKPETKKIKNIGKGQIKFFKIKSLNNLKSSLSSFLKLRSGIVLLTLLVTELDPTLLLKGELKFPG